MKKKQLQEIIKNDIKDLESQVVKLKNELQEVNVAIISGKEKNIKKPRGLRRDIAQIMSIIQQKKGQKAE